MKAATTLAAGDARQHAALVAELQEQAQWVGDGKVEGSPYLALETRLRKLVGQLLEAGTKDRLS